MKILIAAALFFTSVTFEQQVIVTKNSVDTNWSVSVSVHNNAFANMLENENMN